MDNSFGFSVGPVSNPNFIPVTSSNTSTWAFNPAGLSGKLTNNQKYLIVAKAFAPSGLSQNVFAVGVSSVQVIIDNTPPTLSITEPNPGGTNSYQRANLGQSPSSLLTGTINDPLTLNSGIKDYQIQMSYVQSGSTYYYDSPVFSSTTVNIWTTHASAAGSWTYPIPITWPDPSSSYLIKIQVRGEDNAPLASGVGPGNISVPTSTGTISPSLI